MEYYSELSKKRTILRDVLPLKKPYALFIEPSNFCNFHCVQCPHGTDNYSDIAGPLMNMSRACMDRLIDELAAWEGEPFRVIRLYLEGESLLCPDFIYLLKRIREEIPVGRIELTTNASLLTEEIAQALVQYELDYVRISIYSVRPQRHIEVTKSTAFTPEQIRKNVERLKTIRGNREKPCIYVKMLETFDGENEEFKEYYRGIADEIAIEPCMNWSNTQEADFIESLYGAQAQNVRDALKKNRVEKYACPYPFHTLSIKSNGDVLVCCVDWHRDTKVGNIFEQSLQEIWNGQDLYQLRELHLCHKREMNRSCAHCEIPFRSAAEDNIDGISIEQFRPGKGKNI